MDEIKPQVSTSNQGSPKPQSPSPPAPPKATPLKLLHVALSILILFVNYFLAQYDKFILSYFRPQILASLSITSPQYALLSGYATGIVYALLALPVAFLADYTSSRVNVLAVASAWWSLCVVFQSLSHDFGQLFCARLGMGIGQAAVEALSISLISDLVEWRNVFLGNAVLYVGVYVGEAVSGQIATAFGDEDDGWKTALRGIGITGIVVAFVLRAVLREPKRKTSLVMRREGFLEGQEVEEEMMVRFKKEKSWGAVKEDLASTVKYLVRLNSFWLLLISSSMRLLAGNVFGYYMPGYLSSLYPDTGNLLSRYGIIVGTVGSFTVIAGGLLTSLFWNRTKLTPIYLTAIGGMVSSLFVLLMVFSRAIAGSESGGVQVLYGTMSLAYLTAELWLGALFSLIALLLPPAYKTFGLAIWSSVQVLVYSSGPEIIGLALRDEDPESEGYIVATRTCLAVIITVGYWTCGVGLLASIGLVRKDLRREFVTGRLTAGRKFGFIGFMISVLIVVVVLFTVSLVYSV